MNKIKRVVILLDSIQLDDLNAIMEEDHESNKSSYIVRLITQEFKRREQEKNKRSSIGRPKKEPEKIVYYPSPDLKYGNRNPYTLEAWNQYWDINEKWEKDGKRPPLPPPMTDEEVRQKFSE